MGTLIKIRKILVTTDELPDAIVTTNQGGLDFESWAFQEVERLQEAGLAAEVEQVNRWERKRKKWMPHLRVVRYVY